MVGGAVNRSKPSRTRRNTSTLTGTHRPRTGGSGVTPGSRGAGQQSQPRRVDRLVRRVLRDVRLRRRLTLGKLGHRVHLVHTRSVAARGARSFTGGVTPTDIEICRTSVAVELGDNHRAIRTADEIDPATVPSPTHYADLGRALAEDRRHDREAVQALHRGSRSPRCCPGPAGPQAAESCIYWCTASASSEAPRQGRRPSGGPTD